MNEVNDGMYTLINKKKLMCTVVVSVGNCHVVHNVLF